MYTYCRIVRMCLKKPVACGLHAHITQHVRYMHTPHNMWATCTTQHVGYMHTPHNMWATCTHCMTCGLHAHTTQHVGYMHTPHNMWATCTHCTTCGLHVHTTQHAGYMHTPHNMRATCTHCTIRWSVKASHVIEPRSPLSWTTSSCAVPSQIPRRSFLCS